MKTSRSIGMAIVCVLSSLAAGATTLQAQSTYVLPKKEVYRESVPIVIRFGGLPGKKGDWITIVPHDVPDDTYHQWQYTGGRRSGELQFSSGLPAGLYEVRLYFDWPKGDYRVMGRRLFLVAPKVRRASTLEELAAILIEEGDNGPNPYTGDPRVVHDWVKRLRDSYDLPAASWKKLIDGFFYPGNSVRHRLWQRFESYVSGLAVSRNQMTHIENVGEVFTTQAQISPSVWNLVVRKHHRGGLYQPGLSQREKDDFLGFAVNQLLNGPLRSMISDMAKQRLRRFVLTPPPPTGPSVGPAPSDRNHCSRFNVTMRLLRLDEDFAKLFHSPINSDRVQAEIQIKKAMDNCRHNR